MSCAADTHCITCSDEGLPMRVVAARDDGLALCADEAGAELDVMVDLVGPVTPGDGLLVHAGVALARIA
ncbi:MAG: HypC/HybG/HupF family hydrogenase formation chaperone [Actinobacteria bacterium]|nr:HypC/HybG/HupF family hydrogenase formation chaperone [Actinomycetota bacterium]